MVYHLASYDMLQHFSKLKFCKFWKMARLIDILVFVRSKVAVLLVVLHLRARYFFVHKALR